MILDALLIFIDFDVYEPVFFRFMFKQTLWILIVAAIIWFLKTIDYVQSFISSRLIHIYLAFVCYTGVRVMHDYFAAHRLYTVVSAALAVVFAAAMLWFAISVIYYAKRLKNG